MLHFQYFKCYFEAKYASHMPEVRSDQSQEGEYHISLNKSLGVYFLK
uniref:Uncharacterized protein n=1 Tax=Amphimedon queenslandica TaxID=400682 RepID=A0A1X7URQ0_AMPQE